MSQRTYSAVGNALIEQTGMRIYAPGTGDGRLDLIQCEFCCLQGSLAASRHPNLDSYIASTLPPYTPHPTLRGYYLIPGRVDVLAGWPGVGRIRATYIGSNTFPNLPDAFVEAQDNNKIQLDQINQVVLTINYDVFYVMHVFFGEYQPEPAMLVNNLYSISEIGGPAGSSVMALSRTETLVRHGSFSILRSTFLPLNIAALDVPLNVVGNQIYLNRPTDDTVSLLTGSIPADVSNAKGEIVSLKRCSISDSFYSRLAASGNKGVLVTKLLDR